MISVNFDFHFVLELFSEVVCLNFWYCPPILTLTNVKLQETWTVKILLLKRNKN